MLKIILKLIFILYNYLIPPNGFISIMNKRDIVKMMIGELL